MVSGSNPDIDDVLFLSIQLVYQTNQPGVGHLTGAGVGGVDCGDGKIPQETGWRGTGDSKADLSTASQVWVCCSDLGLRQ